MKHHPFLALALLAGCTGSTSSGPDTTPAVAAGCHVEIAVETGAGPSTNVDLGPDSCKGTRSIGITRPAHEAQSWFVVLAVDGAVVRSDVVPVTEGSGADVGARVARGFLEAVPPEKRSSLPQALAAPPLTEHSVVPGEWREIDAGAWPDGERYRVRVRVVRT